MKKRLLVVDDDFSIREALKKLLKDNGYDVLLAVDREDADEKLATEPIDLLVLDLELPNRESWDVLGRVSSQSPLLPVIVITALTDQLDTGILPALDALLEKPIEVVMLLQKVEELLTESTEQRLQRLTGRLKDCSAVPEPSPSSPALRYRRHSVHA